MKLELEKYVLALRIDRKISRNSFSKKENILVKLEYNGITGIGEASPLDKYNETFEIVYKQLTACKSVLPSNPEEIKITVNELENKKISNSAICAIDMALYDIVGKMMKKALYSMLGLIYMPTGPVTKTLYIETPEKMIAKAKEFKGQPLLKVKVDSAFDIANIRKIYEASNYAQLIIDVNEGWELDEAIDKIKYLSRYDFIEFFEQPIKSGSLENLEQLKRKSKKPVYLDEDIVTIKDLDTKMELADGVNIKIQKCGGVYKAIEMITHARKNNFKVMLSSFIESTISITAAAHLIPLVDYIDLDGNLYLENEKYQGAFIDKKSNMNLPNRPGLGVIEMNSLH